MYDYNNKSNEKQVRVPTWRQNWLFSATTNVALVMESNVGTLHLIEDIQRYLSGQSEISAAFKDK